MRVAARAGLGVLALVSILAALSMTAGCKSGTGPGIGEMLHAATIAVAGEVPLDTLWHAVPSFPTISEVWLRLLEAYGL